MTESIFDPSGPDTEQSGTRNLGPQASNISHMPPEVTDGKAPAVEEIGPDADEQTEEIAAAEADVEQEKSRDRHPGQAAH